MDASMPSTSAHSETPMKKSVGTFTGVSPRKPFCELGQKQKKRRAADSAEGIFSSASTSEELSYVYMTKLKADGHGDIAKIVEHLLINPQDVKKVKECLSDKTEKPVFTSDEALGLL